MLLRRRVMKKVWYKNSEAQAAHKKGRDKKKRYERGRQATGDRRQATGDRRQATGDRRQATGDRRQATGDRRQATGDRQE
ncbi:hypothetical protein AFK63_06710 [Cronobacter muytjensii ATCC 51329]|nr:hypothetical protein AFK63_06710 [Cronobacter muytjensii ATCC 51329]